MSDTAEDDSQIMPEANFGVFDRGDVVEAYDRLATAQFMGEELCWRCVASEVRGMPVLDIGIGAGRTTGPLLLLSDDYVGIDLVPTMVVAERRSFPGVDLRVMDARDLSAFDDDSFSLVNFSFNGIDVVSHDDRTRVLTEFARVLRPGGYLLYS